MPAPAIALIGLGRWGRNYLRTIKETGTFRLAAVCDSDPRIEPLDGVRWCRSSRELLGCAGLDAAIIATPNPTHAELARRCIEAGLDVLVEKPMADNSAEGAELVELSERHDRILAAAFPALYLPGFDRARSWLATGARAFGARIESFRTSAGTPDPDADVLWDLAPHDLALAISLFGLPTGSGLDRTGTRADYRVEFRDGASLRGAVEWRTGNQERWFRVLARGAAVKICEEPASAPGDRPLARLLADFAAACAGRHDPLGSGRLGLEVVRCLESLEASARESEAPEPMGAATC